MLYVLCIVHRATYISLVIYVPILLLVTIIGLAMHASYSHCDPLVSKTISSGDQVTRVLGIQNHQLVAQ